MRIRNGHAYASFAQLVGAIVLATMCVVIGAARSDAQPSSGNRGADTCRVAPATRLNLAADSVGPLGVEAPLAELLRRCPAAYIDTTLQKTFDTDPQAEPTVLFPFNGLRVSAIAAGRASAVDSALPVHLWFASGSGAWLPRGVRSNATWRELRAAYGNRGSVWVEDKQATVVFCAARGLVLYFVRRDYARRDLLEADEFDLRDLRKLSDAIQPDARIRAIGFNPGRPKGFC